MADENTAPTVGDIDSGNIDDDIRASIAELKGDAAPEAAETPEPETPAEQPEDDKAAQEGRARDPETGRFVAKDKPEGEEPEPVETQPETPEAAPETEEQPDPLDPPVEWTLEEQEAFRGLPHAQQQFILDRLNGFSEKLTAAEQSGGRFKALDELLAPRRDAWAREGADEIAVLRQLFALTDYAKDKPLEFIQWFAQGKGIDLSKQFAPKQPATIDDEQFANDPLVQQFNAARQQDQATIQQLQQQIQQLQSTFQSRTQQEEKAAIQRVDQEITAFSSETDAKGKPAHPYFPMVRGHMSALMEKGLASTLKDAYDQACHANPEVRAKIAAAEKFASEQERLRRQKEKAAAARNAGSSVSGTPVTTRSEPQSTGDVYDDLRTEFAAARGAAAV